MPVWRTSATWGWSAKGSAAIAHPAGQFPVAVQYILLPEQVQGRQPRSAGQGIAGVAVGMQEGFLGGVISIKRLVNTISCQHGGKRQVASGDAFRQAEKIGRNAGLLAGKQCAGPSKPDGDFIGDQMDTVTVAGFPQQGNKRDRTCAWNRRTAPRVLR